MLAVPCHKPLHNLRLPLEENIKNDYKEHRIIVFQRYQKMDSWLILTLGTIIISFLASFSGFLIYLKKPLPEQYSFLEKNLAFAPFYLICAFLFCLIYLLVPTENDFINNISFAAVIIPMILAGIVYVFSLFQKTAKFTSLALLAAVAVSTFLLPEEFLLFKGNLPFWLDRLAIIAVWFIFSNFFYILNGIDGFLGSAAICVSGAFIVLGLLDAMPFFFTLTALCLTTVTAAFLIFNWFPSRLSFTTGSCRVLGFILGWLLTFTSSEGLAPCNLILITVFVLELLQAAFKKISLRDRYNSLTVNTTYYQANISGLSPSQVCIFLFKLQTIFIILACFQLYMPNAYSLPALSLILGAWFLTKLKNWQTPDRSLSELNKDIIEDLRRNIDDIKKLGKD